MSKINRLDEEGNIVALLFVINRGMEDFGKETLILWLLKIIFPPVLSLPT